MKLRAELNLIYIRESENICISCFDLICTIPRLLQFLLAISLLASNLIQVYAVFDALNSSGIVFKINHSSFKNIIPYPVFHIFQNKKILNPKFRNKSNTMNFFLICIQDHALDRAGKNTPAKSAITVSELQIAYVRRTGNVNFKNGKQQIFEKAQARPLR